MKKIMTIAAAAIAGVAMADITSQNIVGYQQKAPQNATGYSFIVPTFVDVGAKTASYDLQNIKLVGADGSGITDFIVGYDSTANLTGNDYYWTTAAESYAGVTEDGWYVGMMGTEKVADVTLNLGEGLYLCLATDGAKVQYAGQVCASAVTNDVVATGYNMIGNASPVALDLQKISLIGADGSGITDFIIGYDSTANLTGDDYYWTTAADSYAGVTEDGWYVGMMGTEKAEVTLQPGEGVYLVLATDGVKYVVPSALQ